jgi:hypothetical protein
MKKIILGIAAAGCLVTSLNAQGDNPQPTCTMCPGTYIPVDELQAYVKKAIAEKRIDQQVRDVDIGKAHIAIGMVYRGKLDAPGKDTVAEHDLVSEVYHIVDGTGTLVLAQTSSTSSAAPRPPKRSACSTGPATTPSRFAMA